jgi:hypothetical protein
MKRWLLTLACLGFVGEARPAEVKPVSYREATDFVTQAVRDGLTRDGVPRELARQLDADHDFVPRCLLCYAVRRALAEYANLEQQPAGPGLPEDLVKRLGDTRKEVRRAALRELVEKYVRRHIEATKLGKEEQQALQTTLSTLREQMLGLAQGTGFEFCPSCDGACLIAPPANPGKQ